MSTEQDNGYMIGHFPCIAHEVDGKDACNSSDALAVYEHEDTDNVWYDGYCYSCCQSFNKHQVHSSSIGGELGVEGGVVTERKPFERKPKAQPLEMKEVVAFIKETGYDSGDYRGIKDEYSRFFGHLTKVSKQGKVLARYYPETKDGKVTGYKCRNNPKDFTRGKLGLTGMSCELSGQVKFKDYKGHRDILVVGGEEDKAAAYQILRENQKRRGQEDYAPVAVVSPTTGEGSAYKQMQKQYDFLNQFENIILGYDNDEAGWEATRKAIEVLPKEKVKIASWTGKDPNKMLQDGNEKQFLSDFFNAKPVVADGVVTSSQADDGIEEELLKPKVPLPEFMADLEDTFAGGIPLGYWVNWIAATGAGKTTTVNEAIRKWVYESPYKVGILSLELTSAQYMIAMISREVGHKVNLIRKPEDAVEFMRQPHVLEARKHLKMNEYGEDRFVLLDDREGSLDNVKRQIELLIKKHGCKLIVIDPLNDLFEASSWDEQSAFIKWMKIIVKTGVIFSCVCHVRKGGVSTDKNGKRIVRELTEDDVSGLSLITKSSGANIFLTRDKYAEDEIERNTTKVTVGKCRWTGLTGDSGEWYYDNKTHTMHNKSKFFEGMSSASPDIMDEPTF